jgi:hypothetical protein
MDRRHLGWRARETSHPASPDRAARLLQSVDGETGSVMRWGYTAVAPYCAARVQVIARQPMERASGSARLKPARSHLLSPMEPTPTSAPRPTHRNARRHQTP